MLALYLGCLFVGGILVMASGAMDAGELDVDVDADVELDVEVDADADTGPGALDAAAAWLPFASLRFWTFFAAFFGLTGVALTIMGETSPLMTLAISAPAGYLIGLGATHAVKRLRTEVTDSRLKASDFAGQLATVRLPVAPGHPGKVRLNVKGRVVDLLAETEEDEVLDAREKVAIYDVRPDGVVLVTRAQHLLASEQVQKGASHV